MYTHGACALRNYEDMPTCTCNLIQIITTTIRTRLSTGIVRTSEVTFRVVMARTAPKLSVVRCTSVTIAQLSLPVISRLPRAEDVYHTTTYWQP